MLLAVNELYAELDVPVVIGKRTAVCGGAAGGHLLRRSVVRHYGCIDQSLQEARLDCTSFRRVTGCAQVVPNDLGTERNWQQHSLGRESGSGCTAESSYLAVAGCLGWHPGCWYGRHAAHVLDPGAYSVYFDFGARHWSICDNTGAYVRATQHWTPTGIP